MTKHSIRSFYGRDTLIFTVSTENRGPGGVLLPNRVYQSFTQVSKMHVGSRRRWLPDHALHPRAMKFHEPSNTGTVIKICNARSAQVQEQLHPHTLFSADAIRVWLALRHVILTGIRWCRWPRASSSQGTISPSLHRRRSLSPKPCPDMPSPKQVLWRDGISN